MHKCLASSLAALLAVAGSAQAQNASESDPGATEQTAPDLIKKPRYTLEVEGAAYYVAPGGDLRLPSSTVRGDKVDVSSLNLDSPMLSPYLEFTFKPGRWGFTASGIWFNTDDKQATQGEDGRIGNIAFSAGDRLDSTLEFWSAEAEVLYRLVDDHPLYDGKGRESLLASLDLRFGARVYDVDTSIVSVSGVSAGAATSTDQFFAEPVIGFKGELDIYKCFTIDLTTTVGMGPWGDTSSYSWDIIVGGAWRPIENFGVLIGYRQLLFNLQNGDGASEFEFDGAMAGLFAGLELRF
jgi:opacity protein-like surface antigen